jgi:hypothetical protein
MSCREKRGVFLVALGILEPQSARHWFRSAAKSRYLTNPVGRSLLRRAFFRVRTEFIFTGLIMWISKGPTALLLCMKRSGGGAVEVQRAANMWTAFDYKP